MTEKYSNNLRVIVLSSLFPSQIEPAAGVFIRERMFRFDKYIKICVVSPQPWFPLHGMIRLMRPGYRQEKPRYETQSSILIYRPRFFALPLLGRRFDAFFMALSAIFLCKTLKKQGARAIDAHFAYPDGTAARLLGKWLNIPYAVTLRGTEVRYSTREPFKTMLAATLKEANSVISVSSSLRELALQQGVDASKCQVVGNGVDIEKFRNIDRTLARDKLGIEPQCKVIITVGGLTERKGFHRVIAILPVLVRQYPDIVYLIVGGASGEGDWEAKLKQQCDDLGVTGNVKFLGLIPSEELYTVLSSADIFVLSTRNEGWANVFLEAMACGLPVVTTRVGGNAEVVSSEEFGLLVDFGDERQLITAIESGLSKNWDQKKIIDYAHNNTWGTRIEKLVDMYKELLH